MSSFNSLSGSRNFVAEGLIRKKVAFFKKEEALFKYNVIYNVWRYILIKLSVIAYFCVEAGIVDCDYISYLLYFQQSRDSDEFLTNIRTILVAPLRLPDNDETIIFNRGLQYYSTHVQIVKE